MKRLLDGWYWEALCLLVYLAIAGTQLFVRPIIGLSDNGDFPKVLGPFGICDIDHERDVGTYVAEMYIFDSACYWDPDLPSSELTVARILRTVTKARGRSGFVITGAGKIHLALMIWALVILLWTLHESSAWLRFSVPVLAILIFTDVGYLAYLNSFYMDTASMIFLLLTAALAAAWLTRPRTWIPGAYAVTGALMGFSKTQHIFTSYALACLAGWFAFRVLRDAQPQLPHARRIVRYWTGAALGIAAATTLLLAITPRGYKAEPLYSVIFLRILPHEKDKVSTVRELGLPDSDAAYSGTHAYSQNSAINNLDWRVKFLNRLSYRTMVGFYVRHPSVTFDLIWSAMHQYVFAIRPLYLSNFEKKDEFPPGKLADNFGWWTKIRTGLMWLFPLLLPLFYAAVGILSAICFWLPAWAQRWPLYPMVMFLTISGAVEFLFPILLDGTEIDRHLFLFHVNTEILILCAYAGAMALVGELFRNWRAGRPCKVAAR